MGLLLDSRRIPVGMKLYSENESKKPVILKVIEKLKNQSNISGKLIRVAYKGLNCTKNIIHALGDGNGYIFSKSVKQLPKTKKVWFLTENDYKKVTDKNGGIIYYFKKCIDDFPYSVINAKSRRVSVKLREKRIVKYNPKLAKKKRLEINRQIEKARELKSSKAKKSEYGNCAKYVKAFFCDRQALTS